MSDEPGARKDGDIARYRSNLKDEVDGAALYRALAEAETNDHLKDLYGRLAESEERHKALWVRKLQEAGAPVPDYRPSFRTKVLGWLARRFGTAAVSPIVTRMEMAATGMYDSQPEAVAEGLPADERSHARLFREISRSPSARDGVDIARLEGRHKSATGNALRAAVLGAQDGLVSMLCLVMGVAGADPGRGVVLLTGVSGLLAGSLSMALGEWISVRSSAELFERQIAIERDELVANPEEEMEELTLIYQAKGLSREEAQLTAGRILANPVTALDTLAREELGITSEETGSPSVAAMASFLTFAVGGILPLIPWLIAGGNTGLLGSAILSGVGLFAMGAAITLFTGRGVVFSGARMLAFGAAAAAITFGIGKIIGVNTNL